MSFRDRLVSYCEEKKRIDCKCCALKSACNRVSTDRIAKMFTESELDCMEKYTWQLIRNLSEQYLEAVEVLFDLRGGQDE